MIYFKVSVTYWPIAIGQIGQYMYTCFSSAYSHRFDGKGDNVLVNTQMQDVPYNTLWENNYQGIIFQGCQYELIGGGGKQVLKLKMEV